LLLGDALLMLLVLRYGSDRASCRDRPAPSGDRL